MSNIGNAVSKEEIIEPPAAYLKSSGTVLAGVVVSSWLIATVYAVCVLVALT